MTTDQAQESLRDVGFRVPRPGDRAGFERLMEGHKDFLRGIVQQQTDARLRSVMEPEDLVRDVMIATYRLIGHRDFSTARSFRRWLGVLAQHRLNDLVRRHFGTVASYGQTLSSESAESSESSDETAGQRVRELSQTYDPTLARITTRHESAEALERVLTRIQPQYRDIIRLLHVERLSTREIATRMGKKPEVVGKILVRALRACRQAMSPRADR